MRAAWLGAGSTLKTWVRGGGLRPVAVVVFLAAFFVAFPDRNLSLRNADAAPLSSPACASGVGVGGTKNAAVASTIGGHGCVVIKYVSSGTPQYETFNYTGADQTWTVPSGVTSATFLLLGAGGGGSDSDYNTTYSGGNGGGGGFATGDYSVTAGQTFTVIVGKAGGGLDGVNLSGNNWQTPATYGGGGQGGSIVNIAGGYASGGGRSAIRVSGASTDLATAGGGGGAGATNNSLSTFANGAPGGGTSGASVGSVHGGQGGTPSAGGAGGTSGWGGSYHGTAGSQFAGGVSRDEGGGGGGGWYGGGGGGDTGVSPTWGGFGGGGGSSYVALLTNGSTTAGSGTSPGATFPSTPSTGGLSCGTNTASMNLTQTSDGGTPLVNYEYHIATTSKPASQPTTWTAFDPAQTTSPLTWDLRALGYTSGTFRFYVRAVNGLGVSTGSWLSDSDSSCGITITASAPGAPTSLTATPGSGSASISFTAGATNGGAVSNYEYSLDGVTYTALSPADATSPVTIPGLTGGTTYTVYLKARNSAGLSSASAAVSVTPLAAAPTLSSVSTTSGTSAGGTSITITGSNFLAGATVTVGGAACTSVTVVSATSITCTTPAGTAGAQNIVVTNTDSQSATLSSGFTYIAAPSTPATPDMDSSSDSGASATDDITSDNTPTISVGSATNGNTVTVTATKAGSANVTCTFTATAQTSCDLGTLADGTWSITSVQTNGGVNSASSTALTMTVDTTRPTVTLFSSTTANGIYVVGATINITATLSETVENGASLTVTLNTGDTVVLTKATGTTLTGTYTVGVGDSSSDLTVSSYVLTSAPTDAAGNAMTSTSVPTGANNIAGAQAIVIDTGGPTVVSATMNSAGTQMTLTMSETLNATTAATSDYAVTAGGTSLTVGSVTVSGSTVVLTISPAAQSGSTVNVSYTAPASNNATSNAALQDTVGNDAVSFTSSATVPAAGATVSSPQTGTTTTSTTTSTSTNTTTTVVVPTTLPRAAVRSTTTTQQFQKVETADTISETTISSAVVTLPNPLLPVVSQEMLRMTQGIGSVAGMAPDGWVKVEAVGTTSVVLTTSDGLRIEIAALTNDNKKVRLNSRGMVIVEHDDFITVGGGGLMPASDASTWLFSTPRALGSFTVDGSGSFAQQYQIGPDVPVGVHTAQINGLAPDGTLRSVEVDVEVIERAAQVTSYNPRNEPRNTIDLTVQAMVLLTVLGAAATRKEERESGDVSEVSVSFRGSNTDERNDLISPRAIAALDRLSFALPARVVKRSPMVARVIADGAYVRALLGVWWLTLPAIGMTLGALAANNTDYQVIMPSIALIVAIMVVGIADALSGFIAIGAFAVLAGINGGFTSTDSVRGVLGVWVLAFAVPLIGSAVRPFRRLVQNKLGVWERTTDVVLIALFGAWAAGAMFSAIPALTGFKTEDADQLDLVRLVALVALLVRYGVENLARIVAPKRLILVENQSLPEVSRIQQVASLLLRTTVFIFVALIFIGNNWALWIGGAMYLVPKLVDLIDDSFPDFGVLHRYMPRGILKTVMMLVVATWWGDLVAENVSNPDDMVQYGFVLLGIPGLVLGTISWFGRSSRPWPSTALTKALGFALMLFGLYLVLG